MVLTLDLHLKTKANAVGNVGAWCLKRITFLWPCLPAARFSTPLVRWKACTAINFSRYQCDIQIANQFIAGKWGSIVPVLSRVIVVLQTCQCEFVAHLNSWNGAWSSFAACRQRVNAWERNVCHAYQWTWAHPQICKTILSDWSSLRISTCLKQVSVPHNGSDNSSILFLCHPAEILKRICSFVSWSICSYSRVEPLKYIL